MKQTILLAALALGLAACAGTPGTEPGTNADAQKATATTSEKVCKYERSRSTGSRMQRVCRDADAG